MYEHETIVDDDRLRMHFAIARSDIEHTAPHWHNHIEVLLILNGMMHIDVDDRSYDLYRRDILLIDTKKIHSTHTFGQSSYLLLQIPKDDIHRLIPEYNRLYLEEYLPYRSETPDSRHEMEDLLLRMKEIFEGQEDGYLLLLTSLFYTFLYVLYRHHTTPLSKETRARKDKGLDKIEQVMDFVKSNFRRPISIEEVSEMLEIRPEYFCRLFKKYTNQTFLQYVNTVRLVHFYHDLQHTDKTISFLLEKNGISNYKVFLRMFRETYGSTPLNIRSSHVESSSPG